MSTGGRHFHCTFHRVLTFYICKVEVASTCLLFIEYFSCVVFQRACLYLSRQKLYNFSQRVHSIDLKIIHNSCFTRICTRKNHALITFFPCLDGNRKGTSDGLERTVKTKFTDKEVLIEWFFGHILIGGKDAYGYG